MKFVFWLAVAMVAYTYLGYVAWLWARCRWRRRPVESGAYFPSVSIVLIARNEVIHIKNKIQTLLTLNYPAEQVELIAVSDGSSDGTDRVLSEFASLPRVQIIVHGQPRGKAAGLNEALKIARGEIVVFTDVRQTIAADAIQRLMENFSDLSVGCASGGLTLGNPVSGDVLKGVGTYWKIEKAIREMESASGSVVGATGALYAVRRSLLTPLPVETILDDVFIPMQVVHQGSRVVFDARAKVWDTPDLGRGREFARKVRTLGGIYQLLQLEPWLLSRTNPVRFEFISHKLLRLAVPFAICAALASSFFLPGVTYRIALVLQLTFYGLGIWGSLPLKWNPLARVADAAFTFVLLNAAAVVAFANFVAGRKPAWSR